MRLPEPESPFEMSSLTPDEKNHLVAQRHADYARTNLIENLIITGELDEAIALGSTEAAEIKEAIDKDDSERCDCEYEVATFNSVGEPTGKTEVAKNYLTSRKVWSDKHGKVVNVYRCHLCGHMNATDQEIDDVHATVNRKRAEMDQKTQG